MNTVRSISVLHEKMIPNENCDFTKTAKYYGNHENSPFVLFAKIADVLEPFWGPHLGFFMTLRIFAVWANCVEELNPGHIPVTLENMGQLWPTLATQIIPEVQPNDAGSGVENPIFNSNCSVACFTWQLGKIDADKGEIVRKNRAVFAATGLFLISIACVSVYLTSTIPWFLRQVGFILCEANVYCAGVFKTPRNRRHIDVTRL